MNSPAFFRLAIIPLAILWSACEKNSPVSPEKSIFSVVQVMRESSETPFEKAKAPRPFQFPRDHFSHPTFKTEWWYWTGNLEGSGQRFAYQLTFFRTSNRLHQKDDPWSSGQSWMGHLALTRLSGNPRFLTQERFERGGSVPRRGLKGGALALAGTDPQTSEIFLHHWVAKILSLEPLTIELSAFQNAKTGVRLRLTAQKPIVLQGEKGLSWKNQNRTNASYYYSSTRMRTEGTFTLDGTPVDVQGFSWFDREWSSGSLDRSQTGWDWFSLHLDDGTDVMLFQIRQQENAPPMEQNFTSGTLVTPDGQSRKLNPTQIKLTPEGQWISPTGAKYPKSWLVSWDDQAPIRVRPGLPDSEWKHRFKYWEGAVTAERLDGENVGRGFLEMTGYEAPATK